jgi:hypothetical protein
MAPETGQPATALASDSDDQNGQDGPGELSHGEPLSVAPRPLLASLLARCVHGDAECGNTMRA